MLDSNLNVNAAIVDEDENALNNQTPKKRGENRVYEILKKFPKETDLVTGTSETNEFGRTKGMVIFT